MPATKPMRALSSRLGLAALTGTALLAAVVGVTALPATGMPSEAQGASEATARTAGSACASDAEGAAVSAYVRAHLQSTGRASLRPLLPHSLDVDCHR